MPFVFGDSHSTRCYGSKYRLPDIIFCILPKKMERFSAVHFKWSAVWKWIRDSWLFDSRNRVVHQKWTTHFGHLATAGELCPLHSRISLFLDLIGFVKFFNGFSISQIAGRQCSNGSSLETIGREGDYFPKNFDLTVPICYWWLHIFACEHDCIRFSSIISSSMSHSHSTSSQIPYRIRQSQSSSKHWFISITIFHVTSYALGK